MLILELFHIYIIVEIFFKKNIAKIYAIFSNKFYLVIIYDKNLILSNKKIFFFFFKGKYEKFFFQKINKNLHKTYKIKGYLIF